MLGFVGVMSGPRCGSDYVVQLTLAGMPIVGIGIGNIEGGTSPTGGPTAVLRRRVSPSWNKARSTFLAVHSCPRSPSSPRHCATIDTRRSQRPGRSPSRVQPAAEEFTLDARGHRQSRCHPLDGPPLDRTRQILDLFRRLPPQRQQARPMDQQTVAPRHPSSHVHEIGQPLSI